MTTYSAPLRDMRFVLQELAGLSDLAALPGFEEASAELVDSVLEESARIVKDVLSPLNRSGDRDGATLDKGVVRTAPGWKEAYRTLVDGTWLGLSADTDYGGAGLPRVVNAAVSEMWHAANMAFALCPMLTQGAVNAIVECADDQQKALFLPPLISGTWCGTMGLTESAAGSDLGAIRTKAVAEDDHYRITGQKIFITYGDHDLSDNIIHLVLARTPTAPPGVKGISLFIVPKILVNPDGSLGAPNDLRCVSLEHKLGIHASPTAVLAFGDAGGAIGYLVGAENRGLEQMFVMMNHARLNVGLQGLGIADRAYQQALAYARQRIQGKPVGSAAAATIVDHPDVRRMLMGMKSQIEAMRALAYVAIADLDRAHNHPDPEKREAFLRRAELYTPIVKGWLTETGSEIASLGVQIHGGMGYIEETGASQHLRDARITTIYEGTTAIQANDLVNRKILRDGGATLRQLLLEVTEEAERLERGNDAALQAIGAALIESAGDAGAGLVWLLVAQARDPRLPAAAAVPLLRLLGIVFGGHQMARAASRARQRLAEGTGDSAFLQAKIDTARYYASNILPQTKALRHIATSGAESVMLLDGEQL